MYHKIDESAEALSILCINICRILDPEFIIIGGGMSLAGDVLLSLIKTKFKNKAWTILDDNVQIVLASECSHAGVIGSALFALTYYNDITDKQDGETWEPELFERKIRPSKSVDVLSFMCSNTSQVSAKRDAASDIGSNSDLDYNFDSSNDHYMDLNDMGSGGDTGMGEHMNNNNGARNYDDVTNENHAHDFYDFKQKDGIILKRTKEYDLTRQLFLTTSALFLVSAGTALYMIKNYGNDNSKIHTSENHGKTGYVQYAIIAGQSCISSYSLYMLLKGN